MSDITSEKGTRERANHDIHVKLDRLGDAQDKTNRIIYMMLGGVIVVNVVIPILTQIFKH